MASPFTVFRRNQKMMLALLTILAMFGFVFLPMVMDMLGSRNAGPRNPVVVKTDRFGSLRESDVYHLQQQHQKLLQALTAAVSQAMPNPELVPAASVRRWLENVAGFGPATKDVVVNRWLLTKQAEKQGVVVSDPMINRFLQEITQNKVSSEQFQTAFRGVGMNVRQFFHILRGELMANELQAVFQASIDPRATTPGQRWDYFNRVKRSANIEAVAVPVSNFAAQVQSPPDEELKAFFEKHKKQYPIPTSPEAGFRKPATIALQYLKSDSDKLLATVSEDEIRQRYEKDKASYDQLFKKPAEKAEPAKDATAPKEDAKPAEQKPANEQKPAAEPVKGPAAEKALPKDSEKKTEPTDKKSNSTSSYQHSSVTLVSMTEDNKPTETKPTDQKQPAATPAEPTKKAESAPAEKAAAEKASPTADKPAPNAEKQPAPNATPAVQNGLTEQIKNYIREQIADEKRGKIFEGIQKQVDEYRQRYNDYNVQSLSKKDATPPTPLNLEQLAKDHGLTFGQTPLMPQWDLRGTELGTSLIGGRVSVADAAYQSLSMFRPAQSFDTQGNVYLFWKSQETKDQVPKFEDPGVREQVLASWKLSHARDQAMKQAKALADEARAAKRPLAEVFAKKADIQVITPPPFTWMTMGNVAMGWQQQAELNTVPQINLAGEEFMRAVFGLQGPGELSLAFNAPKTVAYVVRLKEFTPHYTLLWEIFQRDDFRTYVSAGAADFQQIQEAWLNQIKTSAGLVWVGTMEGEEAGDSVPAGEEY